MEQRPEARTTGVGSAIRGRTALGFVVLLGVVSLFADATYEGARSITGPYLQVLGASATAVGIIAGFGELIGYSLRLASGYLADRTRSYWAITFVGYALNLLAVPLLALAGNWQLAALLIIAERTGKALRTPARDAMLASATTEMGRGWGFGLHEAMDQAGAVLGPLLVTGVVYWRGGYEPAFAVLLVPAILALATLTAASRIYPQPAIFEPITPELETKGFPRRFWLYLAGACLIALGFADFPLIAFRFEDEAVVSAHVIPVFYAVAMAADAAAALVVGRTFDRAGMVVLIVVAGLSAAFAPLVFLGGAGAALAGVIIWAIGIGTQESVLRAAVAPMVSAARRATAYGIFNAAFGVAWFAGSAAMGVIYDQSIGALVAFCIGMQLLSIPFFAAAARAK
jgi:predicted MFS family arabinose efflux permease